MSVEKKKTKFYLGRKRIALVVIILLIFASLEIYAQNYVQIHSLSVITEENIQSYQQQFKNPNSFLKTDTYNFSSSGCQWLLILETRKNASINFPRGVAYVDIFKTQQNGSLFISSTELLILDINGQTNNTYIQGGSFVTFFDGIFYNGNYTTLRISYELSWGTYYVVFNLTVRIYQRTLIGIIPKEQVTISLNTTIF